ncbi:MAG TPA: hypothetical protein VGK49_03230 [Ilumatobacteraceae bacterium]
MTATVPTSSPDVGESRKRLSRRQLLGGVAAVAAAGAVAAGPGRSALEWLPFIGGADDPLTRSALAPHIGETFRLTTSDGTRVSLVLVSVDDVPALPIVNPDGQFRARFAGPIAPVLTQDTYELSNRSFGRFRMFLVPMTESGDSRATYEAVFNRIEPGPDDRAPRDEGGSAS